MIQTGKDAPFDPKSLQNIVRIHPPADNLHRDVALERLVITDAQEYLTHSSAAQLANQPIGSSSFKLGISV